MTDWFDLEHLGVLTISGEDAAAFSQAQFSADLEAPLEGWRPLAWCSPKGRVIATMLAAPAGDRIELALPTSMVEKVAERLPVFAIGRRVDIVPGGHAAGCLDGAGQTGSLSFDRGRSLQVARRRASADPAALREWRRSDIRAGMPWVTPESSNRYLPQELGLEALEAVSYRKGCFPGQEVIARVHYLGRTKRGLVGLNMESTFLPPPGTRLLNGSGEPAGELIDSERKAAGGVALAVIATGVEMGSELRFERGDHVETARVTPFESLC